NVTANRLGQVACERSALSDANGPATLHLSASDMSASLRPDFDFQPTDAVPVQTTTLDIFLTHAPTQGRLVIKVDVEGHEAAFFAGARRTLATLAPDIVAEVAVDYDDATRALLREADYRFYPLTDRGLNESDALTPVVREPFVFLNYLLTRKSPIEVAQLFKRIQDRVARIDLAQTSKCLDPQSLAKFKAREARRHTPPEIPLEQRAA